jgi:hypothetical protein
MSPRKPGGYNPARLSAEEFQSLGIFFKDLFAENPLIKYSIIAAGIAGALESLHIGWLFVWWMSGRIR